MARPSSAPARPLPPYWRTLLDPRPKPGPLWHSAPSVLPAGRLSAPPAGPPTVPRGKSPAIGHSGSSTLSQSKSSKKERSVPPTVPRGKSLAIGHTGSSTLSQSQSSKKEPSVVPRPKSSTSRPILPLPKRRVAGPSPAPQAIAEPRPRPILYGNKYPVYSQHVYENQAYMDPLPPAWDHYAQHMMDKDDWHTGHLLDDDEFEGLMWSGKKRRESKAEVFRPKKKLGKGGFARVALWQRGEDDESADFVAVKDLVLLDPFYGDYISEGRLLKRLGALNGCHNICEVLDWVIGGPSHARIVLEYCDLGTVRDLVSSHSQSRLCFPEHFLWHVYSSLAKALCFCKYGTDDGTTLPNWDEIVHFDIKGENVMLCTAPTGEIYPVVKLCDFGIAFTIPNRAVRLFKSYVMPGGIGRLAPEMSRPVRQAEFPSNKEDGLAFYHDLEARGLVPGSHTDVYALGQLMVEFIQLAHDRMRPAHSVAFQSTTPHGHLYSSDMILLVDECRLHHWPDRPEAYALVVRTNDCYDQWKETLTGDDFESGRVICARWQRRNPSIRWDYRLEIQDWVARRQSEIQKEKPWRKHREPTPARHLIANWHDLDPPASGSDHSNEGIPWSLSTMNMSPYRDGSETDASSNSDDFESDDDGDRVDSKGNRINEDGNRIDEDDNLIDEEGNLIDEEGNLIDEEGNLIDEEGNRVDSKGNRIDEDGNRIDEDYNLIDEDGKRIDDDGNRIVDDGNRIVDDGNRIVDDGNRIVDDGNRIVDDGNRIVDDGNRIVDDGNRIDDEGNLILSNGNHLAKDGEDDDDSNPSGDNHDNDETTGLRRRRDEDDEDDEDDDGADDADDANTTARRPRQRPRQARQQRADDNDEIAYSQGAPSFSQAMRLATPVPPQPARPALQAPQVVRLLQAHFLPNAVVPPSGPVPAAHLLSILQLAIADQQADPAQARLAVQPDIQRLQQSLLTAVRQLATREAEEARQAAALYTLQVMQILRDHPQDPRPPPQPAPASGPSTEAILAELAQRAMAQSTPGAVVEATQRGGDADASGADPDRYPPPPKLPPSTVAAKQPAAELPSERTMPPASPWRTPATKDAGADAAAAAAAATADDDDDVPDPSQVDWVASRARRPTRSRMPKREIPAVAGLRQGRPPYSVPRPK
ncbi:MAG: hypothetical protein M1826_001329 [Phylliscum demangeonii]|nr:MAG: hypothetical protein M1826_001329 [Phylliscum demangeonii]